MWVCHSLIVANIDVRYGLLHDWVIIQLVPTNLVLVMLRNEHTTACLVFSVHINAFVHIVHVLVLFVKVIGVERLIHRDCLSQISSFFRVLLACFMLFRVILLQGGRRMVRLHSSVKASHTLLWDRDLLELTFTVGRAFWLGR